MTVRAVLFDAGNTLLEFDYVTLTDVLRSRGHGVTLAAVTDAERRARIRLDEERAPDPGRRGEGRYVNYLLGNLGIDGDAERRAIADWRRTYNLPVGLCRHADPNAVDALRRVRDAGLVAGVISNSNGSVRMALDKAGLGAHLDFVIDSTVVGVAKPDPRAFHLGLEAARAKPEEAVYVGDSYFVDVLGSQRVGMRGILFDPGSCWGRRDCVAAADLRTAVDRALSEAG
jgi:HAD superfamily hydrolase (TIGR01509 family)